MLGNFLVAAQLTASQDGLGSMELVSYISLFDLTTDIQLGIAYEQGTHVLLDCMA
jgi:hypothetical protein